MSLWYTPLALLHGEPWCGNCWAGWVPFVERVERFINGGEKVELLKRSPEVLPATEETGNSVVRYYSAVAPCSCRVEFRREQALQFAEEAKRKNLQSGKKVLLGMKTKGLLPKGE